MIKRGPLGFLFKSGLHPEVLHFGKGWFVSQRAESHISVEENGVPSVQTKLEKLQPFPAPATVPCLELRDQFPVPGEAASVSPFILVSRN